MIRGSSLNYIVIIYIQISPKIGKLWAWIDGVTTLFRIERIFGGRLFNALTRILRADCVTDPIEEKRQVKRFKGLQKKRRHKKISVG